ncbi:MAG: 30S ribosome-binding factor RbfA [Armatimonadota bacterium]|nr:30S ribosome-binding factor RbfA [Armatimonadota bacterium]MDR7468803.1 30S ribosome-binding factor RbfA [Armatimonadota bacterium]MDR7473676.1 30S ribosome-binding factor RbfA [Armatimonadota bacterium]MDR7538630.1 30S ribosome-binding factor RbfA [Armatimonadota bacterium]
MGLRREKLQELLKAEASAILQRELRDPRIGFVSVTEVQLSADLRHAKIFVSVLGDQDAKRRTMEALERAAGYVRSELGRRVSLRHTPEVLFRLDESIERGTRVVALLRRVARQDAAAGQAPGEPGGSAAPVQGKHDRTSRPDRRGAP